jgi:hypothetical protein
MSEAPEDDPNRISGTIRRVLPSGTVETVTEFVDGRTEVSEVTPEGEGNG